MKAPRTIYAKGLVLISIPLILELAFGLSLFCLQHYYQDKLKRERIAAEIIFNANEIWINCSEIMLLQAARSFLGSPREPIEERIGRLSGGYDVLAKLVADDSAQRKNVEKIRAYTYQAIELTNGLQPLMSKGKSVSSLAGIRSNVDTFKAAYDAAYPVLHAIQDFAKPEFMVHGPLAIREVELASSMVNRIVLVSLCGSTIAAVVLFIYFIKTINRGVKALLVNTERFRRDEELNPSIGGGDELAQVDAAFHAMAGEIKEAQRTKQAVLAVISHDLRSPLTSVLACFTLLGVYLNEADETTKTAVEQQERDVEQLVRMINDLLDLEKMEAGKLKLAPELIPVESVIERSIVTVERFADLNESIIRSAHSDAKIYADPDWLIRALANVLFVAVKISPRRAFIETSVFQHEQESEICVTCPSITIDVDTLKAMFDRYQKRETGIGLELPLSAEIVKLHGGTIGIASEPPAVSISMRLCSVELQKQA